MIVGGRRKTMPIITATCADCGSDVRVTEPDPATLPPHQCTLRRARRERRALYVELRREITEALGALLAESPSLARIAQLDRLTHKDTDVAAAATARTFRYEVHQALLDLPD
jgi:hypothetical protein